MIILSVYSAKESKLLSLFSGQLYIYCKTDVMRHYLYCNKGYNNLNMQDLKCYGFIIQRLFLIMLEFSHLYVCNNEDVPQVMKSMFFPIKK